MLKWPGLLNLAGAHLSVVDHFGTLGDTLLTAIVCQNLRRRYPRLKINCITPNPELINTDPSIDKVNQPKGFFVLPVEYLEIIHARRGDINILQPTFRRLGIQKFDYQGELHLTALEKREARLKLQGLNKPLITLNTQSREIVKTWPPLYWQELVRALEPDFALVQLGTTEEPRLEGVTRLAGTLTPRESTAVLSQASLHVGLVSFLMHAASALRIPSVIIFGGRETPRNSGYPANRNLYSPVDCSPCWIHDSHGERCPYGVKCMTQITPSTVLAACRELLPLNLSTHSSGTA